jgi:hypothetical protein
MAWVFRGNGAWGTGLGSPLTQAQFDGNTYETKQRVEALEAASGSASEITNIEVAGAQITFYMASGDTFGPYTIPLPAPAPAPVIEIVDSTFTPSFVEANCYLRWDNASDLTFTIPAEADTDFGIDTEFHLRHVGVGSITVVGASGVTINSAYGCTDETLGPGSTISVKKVASDEWDVIGGQLVAG